MLKNPLKQPLSEDFYFDGMIISNALRTNA